jgi:two-component system response regulator ResD
VSFISRYLGPEAAKTNRTAERILLVEDSPDFQLIVRANLEKSYSLEMAGTLAEARRLLAKQSFQLLLLDANLPDGDGFSFCRELRAQTSTQGLPVIFLTGRSELEDKLRGFSLGADDYIVKPFESLELQARVEVRLARERGKPRSEESCARGPLLLDLPTQRAYLREAGRQTDVGLTPIEFKILYRLMRQEDRVVSREDLLETVWGPETHVFDRATDKHVSALRQKLGASAAFIQTVSRAGYRFALRATPSLQS